MVEEFNSSKLTRAAFCREWNINPKTFGRWLRADRQKKEISFCELELPANMPQGDATIIRFPNGIEVALSVASRKELGSVLREVATCLG